MKYLLLLSVLISCNQKTSYEKKKINPSDYLPDIIADASGRTKNETKLFSGTLKKSRSIVFHGNETCSDKIIEVMTDSFPVGISIPLTEGENNISYEIITSFGKKICFGLVRSYDKDTTAPNLYPLNNNVDFSLLTEELRNIRNSAVQVSGGEDIHRARFFSDNSCLNEIGTGINLNSVDLLFPDSQVTRLMSILEDDLGNESVCVDTGIDYEHDIVDPTISPLASPDSGVNTQITLRGTVNNTSQLIGIPALSLYKDNCGNKIADNILNSFETTGVIVSVDNLTETNFYARMSDSAGNETCVHLKRYTHVLGSINENLSEWNVEKNIVSEDPIENNKVSFSAKDINSNPISGIAIKIDLIDQRANPVSPVELDMIDDGNGEYSVQASLGYSYKIKVTDTYLPSFTQRDIGNVIATSTPYCYEQGREVAVNYDDIGSGTSLNPYEICFADQLKSMSENCNAISQDSCDKEYTLMNNIDLNNWYAKGTPLDQEFIIAEDPSFPFVGKFNGNNLEIKNYKYSQDLTNFKGMFGYGGVFSILNLNYSYNYTSAIADSVGGLIHTINGNATLGNNNIDGTVVVGASAKVGGVVYSAQNIFSHDNSIKLSVTNASEVGGFFHSIQGVSFNPVSITRIYSELTISHDVVSNTGHIGGIAAYSDYTDFSDVYSKLDISTNSMTNGRIGGLIGAFYNGIIVSSFSEGTVTEVGNGFMDMGGIAAIVSSGTISDSFSLVNISTTDCLNKCGKILGDTLNPIDSFFENLYASSQSVFNLGAGFLNGSVVETNIDTGASPTYFFDEINDPLSFFDNLYWDFHLDKTPTLK